MDKCIAVDAINALAPQCTNGVALDKGRKHHQNLKSQERGSALDKTMENYVRVCAEICCVIKPSHPHLTKPHYA